MAKLDRPLFGVSATGTFARALAFRKTPFYPSVAQLPLSKTSPSPAQSAQRLRYRDACSAWDDLSPEQKQVYVDTRPLNLSGFNLFIRLFLSDSFAYFYYSTFGTSFFMLVHAPDQPAIVDYDLLFPLAPDEFPVLRDGADSFQAWFLNHLYDSIIGIENFLIDNKTNIEE